MKAAKLNEHPIFSLMKQTDIQRIYHLQMPRWLFSDARYADMSLDAKVAYTFLLNRFQLSRRKGWVNEDGEVFVIFPRRAMAQELRICEKRVTAAFYTLAKRSLIWEKRCGRGDANQIYLAQVEPQDDPHYTCEPFVDADTDDSRTADLTVLEAQEQPISPFQNSRFGGSRTADSALLEPQNPPPSYIDKRKKEESYKEVSPSVTDSLTDEEELTSILEGCDLDTFAPEMAHIFENAIERLYYSDSLRVGGATLPQCRVRARLHLLDMMVLRDAESKICHNAERIRNSTQYIMSVIFNCITESESDLELDPYLNSLRSPPGKGGAASPS